MKVLIRDDSSQTYRHRIKNVYASKKIEYTVYIEVDYLLSKGENHIRGTNLVDSYLIIAIDKDIDSFLLPKKGQPWRFITNSTNKLDKNEVVRVLAEAISLISSSDDMDISPSSQSLIVDNLSSYLIDLI